MKYFKQEQDHTCGPASMRMILSSLSIKKSESSLARLLKTSKSHGTSHLEFPNLAKKLKLSHVIGKKDSKIKDLKAAIKKDFKIIVCYFSKQDKYGHYAVVKSINSKNIYLLDPDKGPNFKMSLKQFIKNWHGTHTYHGWFIGIKKFKNYNKKL